MVLNGDGLFPNLSQNELELHQCCLPSYQIHNYFLNIWMYLLELNFKKFWALSELQCNCEHDNT